jgi:glycosyltransferase involved in cell wall biosynthesis
VLKIKRKKRNFLLIFDKLRNISLIKDTGMIPYYFHRKYHYNSKILTYKNEKAYPFLNKYCKGLELEFLKKRRIFNKVFGIEIPGMTYLIKNSKNIHILEVIWLSNSSILYGILYKLLNRNGILYLKLDATEKIKHHNKLHPYGYYDYQYYKDLNLVKSLINSLRIILGRKISKFFFKKLDLASIESKKLYEDIKNYPRIKNKLIYLPNGINDSLLKDLNIKRIEFNKKQNIILTVGRIGWIAKDHHVLLEAVANIKDLKNWKIYFVGGIYDKFKNYIHQYFERYPNLKDKIIFTGEILNRKKLFEFYQKSKIFCLTSNIESFGIVLVEAGYFGNYIVSTNLPAARDITLDGQLGTLFSVRDTEKLTEILEYLINNEEIIENNLLNIQDHIDKNFLWTMITAKLYKELIKAKKKSEITSL